MTTLASTLTTRFGAIEFIDDDIIHLCGGILGFPDGERFVLVQHKEGSRFRWLQSLDDPKLAFLVVDPAEFFANYAPEITDKLAADLGLNEETPRLVYTIVTIPRGQPEAMTANLAGPIVINLETRKGVQVIIEDPAVGIKHPLGVISQQSAA